MIKYCSFIFLLSLNCLAMEKSICGRSDDREFSNDQKIGRVNDGVTSVCTVTMISKKCALTAGHCNSILDEVSFNVPRSIDGNLSDADEKDRYEVDRYETYFAENGPGDDYAVIELLPNKITGKLAGEAQGFYDVSFEGPKVGDAIFITGFGKDARGDRNHSQQTHQAQVIGYEASKLQHNIDTRFGNSGSVIIDDVTKKIIAIHTHGACYENGGSNFGTLIARHTRLSQAIRNCLSSEE